MVRATTQASQAMADILGLGNPTQRVDREEQAKLEA